MRQIALYGKGGIGKSTTTSNLSAALSKMDNRVMQIGCDPKSDSTVPLTQGKRIPTVLELIREQELRREANAVTAQLTLEDLVYNGFNGVLCCEAGGPEPGVGCAGRGVITAIEMLKNQKAFEIYQPDVVLYDVLGDVVCGGFAMPIRQGLAEEVYVITSGEMMAIYACNNIFKGIYKFAKGGNIRVGGILLNSRGTPMEEELIRDFAKITGTEVIYVIPRDKIVQKCEMAGQTVIEGAPGSKQYEAYMEMAGKIVDNTSRTIP
ncbi:MAG: nitrogenase iron protein NifH, partial [Desulfuromonadaceae bacterium]